MNDQLISNLKRELKFCLNKVEPNPQITEIKFDDIYKKYLNELKKYNCKFRYQNKNSKKNGHLKFQENKLTNKVKLELAINRDDDETSKIYTFFHELTHLTNHHYKREELTKKQKEIIADTVGKMLVKYYGNFSSLANSSIQQKMDIMNYSNNYMHKMQISKKKLELLLEEIIKTFYYYITVYEG